MSTPLRKSNQCFKRKEITYLVIKFALTGQNFFVFYESTTTAGVLLNDEKFGMFQGNHIRRLIRKRIGASILQKCLYVLRENACYADSETATGSYTETI